MFSHDVEGWHTEKEPKQPKVTPPRETDDRKSADTEREQSQQPDDKGERQ